MQDDARTLAHASGLKLNPLRIGVTITGVDLRQPCEAATADRLRSLLAEHQLLHFPGQDLSPDDQVRVMETFGKVLDENSLGRRYQYVSGDKAEIKPGRLAFHCDNQFTAKPLEVLSLYGEDVGDAATPTLYVSGVKAVGRLPEALRRRLDGAEVVSRSHFHLGYSDRPARTITEEHKGAPEALHPAIRRHPVTGAPFLYVNDMNSHHIVGLPRAESDALIEAVLDILYEPAEIYAHHWRTGGLVIWENSTLQHGRAEAPEDADPARSARSLRRVVVGPLSFADQFEFPPEAVAEMAPFYADRQKLYAELEAQADRP